MLGQSRTYNRYLWLDALRAIAIVLMVVFHFCYDLRYFGWVDWHVPNGEYWRPFRYVIVSLFVLTMGFSMGVAHQRGRRWKPFFKRLLQLSGAALCITLMSLFMFPQAWIYFGILHFFVVASLCCFLLVRLPWVAILAAIVIFLIYFLALLPKNWPFNMMPFLPTTTEDFVPLLPWLGVAFVGLFSARFMQSNATFFLHSRLNQCDQLLASPQFSWFPSIGRYSLIIYLVHQPILFAGFMLVSWIVK